MIDPSYMSEESTHESEGDLVMHVYRSEGKVLFLSLYQYCSLSPGLNKLIERLDKKYKGTSLKRNQRCSRLCQGLCVHQPRESQDVMPQHGLSNWSTGTLIPVISLELLCLYLLRSLVSYHSKIQLKLTLTLVVVIVSWTICNLYCVNIHNN